MGKRKKIDEICQEKIEIDNFIESSFQKQVEIYEKKLKGIDLEHEVNLYANNSDSSAFERLYFHFKPHFERIAYQKRDEDLIQELSEVLWNATLKYKFDAGVKFKTFFWTCVHNHIGTKKIRQGAKKRSVSQVIQVKSYNSITGEEEIVEEKITTNTISLNLKVKSDEDSGTEMGAFIENQSSKNDYDNADFYISLQEVLDSDTLKENEKIAIKMVVQGYTLSEIGETLNGLTPPAIHFMLKRLRDKKIVREKLWNIIK